MRPLARGVERLLRGLGIAADVERARAIDAWPLVAADVLGPDAASTTVVGIDGEVLVVAVPTSGWSAEIRLRESELIARLAGAVGRSGIRRIRTVPAQRSSAP